MIYMLTGFLNKADKRALSIQEFKDGYDVAGYIDSLFITANRLGTKKPIVHGNILESLNGDFLYVLAMDQDGLWNFYIFFDVKKRASQLFNIFCSYVKLDDEKYAELINEILVYGGNGDSRCNGLKDHDYSVLYKKTSKYNDDVLYKKSMLTQAEAYQLAYDCYVNECHSISVVKAMPTFVPMGRENGIVEDIRI